MKKVQLEIVATGHKLNSDDSLLVVIAPQWADYTESIHYALKEITGHDRHAILPIPKDDIKIFSVQHPIIVSKDMGPTGIGATLL